MAESTTVKDRVTHPLLLREIFPKPSIAGPGSREAYVGVPGTWVLGFFNIFYMIPAVDERVRNCLLQGFEKVGGIVSTTAPSAQPWTDTGLRA